MTALDQVALHIARERDGATESERAQPEEVARYLRERESRRQTGVY
jgi:hypothetical protein